MYYLALELVDEVLHPFVVLAVLISGEGQRLIRPLGFAQMLALSVKLELKLTDAGFHLNYGFPAALQGVDLGLIAGVSGNSRLPYKFLGISREFIKQTGIPAHPWSQDIAKLSIVIKTKSELIVKAQRLPGLLLSVKINLRVLHERK